MRAAKKYDFIIIGAGASGCFAAITAAKRNKKVLLLEKNDTIAKKILATGNGRCNFSNLDMREEYYHGDKELIHTILKQLSVEEIRELFHELGITSIERNGYLYPASNQAKSVVKAFEMAMDRYEVEVKTSFELSDCYKENHSFFVEDNAGNRYQSSNVLFSTGLLASNLSGIEDSAFSIIKSFGHHFTTILPALCGFYCEGIDFKALAGMRINGCISLLVDCQNIASDTGELQFNEYGISGIPVFQISSLASKALNEKKETAIEIDFFPELTEQELLAEMDYRIHAFEKPLNGLVPDKLEKFLENTLKGCFDAREYSNALKHFFIQVNRAREFKYSQICIGGVKTEELKENSLESALEDGLFFSGELVDIDGICGGYNLHFAWESGYFVGSTIE